MGIINHKLFKMKNIFYLIIIVFFIQCGGGEDSDESTIEVSKTFLEEHGNTVWVLDMGGFEEKDYLFFFNEPNGTFFSKAYDEGESHSCTSFTSGSISINGEVVYTEITQNDNQCLKFSYEYTGVTGTFEICEATYSTGTPGLMVKDIYNSEIENEAYRRVSGVTYSQICN